MSLSEPFRGEVWDVDVDVDGFGPHPAVVLSIKGRNARLGHRRSRYGRRARGEWSKTLISSA